MYMYKNGVFLYFEYQNTPGHMRGGDSPALKSRAMLQELGDDRVAIGCGPVCPVVGKAVGVGRTSV